ncbi:hypothetical protein AQI95_19495 [Streptomyces yokosukanensis]|uniref:Lipoprotein n=1 Tax=Streptomyces yokosukanensis TaxID=67386 RepID=A0A101P412_9ACTN|nr:hypothetical protein [Streptomyces yokosukanensis]KUN04533.1 hypothetical protein AQI95_19495 [Streptomyces yokosukanensis]
MRHTFLAAGVALAAALTGCTASRSPADRSAWSGDFVREAAEEFASLCAVPAVPPGPGGGAAPAPAVRTLPGEGDEEPMPPLPGGTILVFCVYGERPASPDPAPEPPSCPARMVSAAQPRPGVAWVVAADGTPTPFPYPRLEARHEEDCAPVGDDVQTRLWR